MFAQSYTTTTDLEYMGKGRRRADNHTPIASAQQSRAKHLPFYLMMLEQNS